MSEFWRRIKDYVIHASFYDCEQSIDVEEMYQEFKARLINEIKVDSPKFCSYGRLVDKEDENDT